MIKCISKPITSTIINNKKDYYKLKSKIKNNDIIAASDGSYKKLSDLAGAGFYISTPMGNITGHQNLGKQSNNFGEWWAYCTILRILYKLEAHHKHERIILLTDSEIIYKTIQNNLNNTTYPNMADYAKKIINIFNNNNCQIITIKVKSHIGLFENEEADKQANLAVDKGTLPNPLNDFPFFQNLNLDCHYSQCDNNKLKYIISKNSIF